MFYSTLDDEEAASDLYEKGVRMGWCLAFAYLGFKVPDEDLTAVLAQPID